VNPAWVAEISPIRLFHLGGVEETLSIARGYLYFTANQVERQALFHNGKDERIKPYSLFCIRIDGGPAPK
jgi:hypothetical protein